MAVRNDNDNTPKLDKKDLDLLKQLDKQMKLQDDLAELRYYYQNKSIREGIYEVKIRPYRVILLENIKDLLYKYDYYKPHYNKEENIFYLNEPLPVDLISTLRADVEKFNIKDFRIIGKDIREGYKWTR